MRQVQMMARKEIDYKGMSTEQKKQLVSEVNILRELKHPNIVRYFDRFVDRENGMIYIMMEYCPHGDLAALIRKCKREKKSFSEDIVWNVLSQLLLALDECHGSSKGIILHRDIKPENVFLDGETVKLGDFGLSRILECGKIDLARTFVGTPYYMSPEIVSDTFYDYKSDIWALGCLIYELCSLTPPFQAETESQLYAKISYGQIPDLPRKYSKDLDFIVKLMLTTDKLKRPTAKDLLSIDRIKQVLYIRDLKLREKQIGEREAYLKQKELDLKIMETKLISHENQLKVFESQLDARAADLDERESRQWTARTPKRSEFSLASAQKTPICSDELTDKSMMIISPLVTAKISSGGGLGRSPLNVTQKAIVVAENSENHPQILSSPLSIARLKNFDSAAMLEQKMRKFSI